MSLSTFVSRRESLDRWHAALKRAQANNVHVYRIESSGQFIATSGTTVTAAYATDGVSCECAAAVHGDPICQHRAAYWAAHGMLTLEETAPVTMPCSMCDGSGQCWLEGEYAARECWYCSGRGSRDVVLDHIGPNNIVEFPRIDSPRPAA